jgi:hypothetical protein
MNSPAVYAQLFKTLCLTRALVDPHLANTPAGTPFSATACFTSHQFQNKSTPFLSISDQPQTAIPSPISDVLEESVLLSQPAKRKAKPTTQPPISLPAVRFFKRRIRDVVTRIVGPQTATRRRPGPPQNPAKPQSRQKCPPPHEKDHDDADETLSLFRQSNRNSAPASASPRPASNSPSRPTTQALLSFNTPTKDGFGQARALLDSSSLALPLCIGGLRDRLGVHALRVLA